MQQYEDSLADGKKVTQEYTVQCNVHVSAAPPVADATQDKDFKRKQNSSSAVPVEQEFSSSVETVQYYRDMGMMCILMSVLSSVCSVFYDVMAAAGPAAAARMGQGALEDRGCAVWSQAI